MKKAMNKHLQTDDIKNFAYISISIATIIIIVTVILSFVMTNKLLDNSNKYVLDNLTQIERNVKSELTAIKSFQVMIHNNPILVREEYTNTPLDKSVIKTLLDNYKYSLPSIDEIIVIKDYNTESEQIKKIYDICIKQPLNLVLIDGESENTKKFYMLYDRDGKGKNAILIKFSDLLLTNILNNICGDSYTDFQIIDKDKLLNYNFSYTIPTDIINEIELKKENNGYFVKQINGEKIMVSFMKTELQGWYFVKYTQYSELSKDVRSVMIIVILIVTFLLALSLIASFALSKKVNEPIAKLSEKVKNLENHKQKNVDTLKKEFLANFIQNNEFMELKTVLQKFDEYGIMLSINHNFVVLLLTLNNYDDITKNYGKNQRYMIKNNVSNLVVDNVISKEFICESVPLKANEIVFIIGSENIVSNENIENLCYDVHRIVQESLNISTIITVSSVKSKINSIPFLYTESKVAQKYTFIYSDYQTIFFTFIEADENNNLVKSAIEDILLKEIKDKNHFATAELWSKFIGELKGHSYSSVKLMLNRVVYSILERIQQNSQFATSTYDIYTNIVEKRNIQEIENEVSKILINANDVVLDESKYIKLSEKAKEIVKLNYCNPQMCANMISEELSLSADYLGRVFKRIEGVSISDYINGIRLDKAAELIKTTNTNIAEIGENVGFTNRTYFSTLFKKRYGIVPSKYRE